MTCGIEDAAITLVLSQGVALSIVRPFQWSLIQDEVDGHLVNDLGGMDIVNQRRDML